MQLHRFDFSVLAGNLVKIQASTTASDASYRQKYKFDILRLKRCSVQFRVEFWCMNSPSENINREPEDADSGQLECRTDLRMLNTKVQSQTNRHMSVWLVSEQQALYAQFGTVLSVDFMDVTAFSRVLVFTD
ncbi:hypothetical protein BB560_005561 [Smittium megazygosporum]|uniref:Uncharacterized protein n=1 Tax=Smittium megazygosporum TaxID=133381 RepID=A0A2T9Z3A9_9FUNG|nr:hypothetical protein BB560_005561 [Smittium megazygosporum]